MRFIFFSLVMAALFPAHSFAACPQLEKPDSVVLVYGDVILPGGRVESEATCIQRGNPTVTETRMRPNGEPLRVEMAGGRLVSWSINHGASLILFRTKNAKGDPEAMIAGSRIEFDLEKDYGAGRPSVTAHVTREIEPAGAVDVSGCRFDLLRVRTLWQEPGRSSRWDSLYAPALNNPLQSRVFELDPKSLQDKREVFRSRATNVAPMEEAERICHPKPQS